MKKCEVYYFSDMQKCMTCGSCWDANDPYPPQCNLEKPIKISVFDKLIAFIFGIRAMRRVMGGAS